MGTTDMGTTLGEREREIYMYIYIYIYISEFFLYNPLCWYLISDGVTKIPTYCQCKLGGQFWFGDGAPAPKSSTLGPKL